jgi:hypothetical protein
MLKKKRVLRAVASERETETSPIKRSLTTKTKRKPGRPNGISSQLVYTWIRVNDPSAGSPTETLLRLLLPLNSQVCVTSQCTVKVTPQGSGP